MVLRSGNPRETINCGCSHSKACCEETQQTTEISKVEIEVVDSSPHFRLIVFLKMLCDICICYFNIFD